jgi:hypothetical protein
MYKIINKKISEEEFIKLINLGISFYKKKKIIQYQMKE